MKSQNKIGTLGVNAIALVVMGLLALAIADTSVFALRPYAYVVNRESHTVSVIDTVDQWVIATIPVGFRPRVIAINPENTRAYVTNGDSNTVTAIDTITLQVVDTIPVEQRPDGIVISPDSRTAYVANSMSNTVSVIDLSQNRVVANILVGNYPTGVELGLGGNQLYVANWRGLEVTVIDTNTRGIIASIPLDRRPIRVTVSPNGRTAYIVSDYTPEYAVIAMDTSSFEIIGGLHDDQAHNVIRFTPDGSRAYVSGASLNATVSVFDTRKGMLLQRIETQLRPMGLDVTGDGRLVYVANASSSSVSVVETATNEIIATIEVGDLPTYVAISRVCNNGC